MSDIRRTQYEAHVGQRLVDELTRNNGADARALTPVEAHLLAKYAWNYRHMAAWFDPRKTTDDQTPVKIPYLAQEIELRPDAPCPTCGQNVHIEISAPATTDSATSAEEREVAVPRASEVTP